ncbi:MAG: hypothetical protein ABI670_01140 [Chloroflexota bacterium]
MSRVDKDRRKRAEAKRRRNSKRQQSRAGTTARTVERSTPVSAKEFWGGSRELWVATLLATGLDPTRLRNWVLQGCDFMDNSKIRFRFMGARKLFANWSNLARILKNTESGYQIFHSKTAGGWYSFDIPQALSLAKDSPMTGSLDVSFWYDQWIAPKKVSIDRQHAMSSAIDLSKPVLVARINSEQKFVIDGWHRIFRASQSGVTSLPCKELTLEQCTEVLVLYSGPIEHWQPCG